jgi:superkiller protein 3
VAGEKLIRSGDYERAVAQLQQAVRLSPDYAAAHSALAAAYLYRKQYATAREEIARAMEIGGPDAADLGNLAVAYAADRHCPEAVEAAKAALRADPGYAPAHYVLGWLLLRNPATEAEAIRNLEEAAPTMAAARTLLSRARTRGGPTR